MKVFIIIIFILGNSFLFGSIIEIKQDGQGDFVNIQDGIFQASNNDTILVYPGTYYENIDFLEKSITVASLNLTTNGTTYTTSTIIDGNQTGSCVKIENVQHGLLQGFTCQNGTGTPTLWTVDGGGVYVKNSNLDLINCIIRENNAENGGGIILAKSTTLLSGVTIYNNHAKGVAGGIGVIQGNTTFDSNNLCSIYLNTATRGNDIFSNGQELNIILDKFTVLEPDVTFIATVAPPPYYYVVDYTFSCQRAAIEPIEADLYVSTSGDNNNSGLTSDDPLQDISMAMIKIKADSLHQRTIHVANGVYSPSLTNAIFPINLRSYVSIIGESEENTIIDGENGNFEIMDGNDSEKNMVIKNFTVRNLRVEWRYCSPFNFYFTYPDSQWVGFSVTMENITIENLDRADSVDDETRCLNFREGESIKLKNITLRNNKAACIPCFVAGNNFYAENLKIVHTEAFNDFSIGGGLTFAYDFYIAEGEVNRVFGLELTDNENIQFDWGLSGILILGRQAKAIVSNATIAENNCTVGIGGAISIEGGNLTLLNSIVYNNTPHEAKLLFGGYSSKLIIKNSLIAPYDNAISMDDNCFVTWLDGCLRDNPQFVNADNNPYFLSENSPCIDEGTVDLSEYFGDDFTIPEFDLAGNPRIYGDTIDMGAYEWNPNVANEDDFAVNNDRFKFFNYPNPFNPTTTISFDLPKLANVDLAIYNIKGQKVKILTNEKYAKGKHYLIWNGTNDNNKRVSSGNYFIKLSVDGEVQAVRKCLLLK